MSANQKQKLAELANQYRVPIIEDDVYLELSYSSHTPLPAKYYDKRICAVVWFCIEKPITELPF